MGSGSADIGAAWLSDRTRTLAVRAFHRGASLPRCLSRGCWFEHERGNAHACAPQVLTMGAHWCCYNFALAYVRCASSRSSHTECVAARRSRAVTAAKPSLRLTTGAHSLRPDPELDVSY